MTSHFGATPWRRLLYKHLTLLDVGGKVVDLGGSRASGYHEFFPKAVIEVANFDDAYGFDHKVDLEQALPFESKSYEGALLINTLEHIFDYSLVLRETQRILKPKGICIVAVPFLVQVHPCPHDHWRFTAETLERIMRNAGFNSVEVKTISVGPCVAACQVMYNVLRFSLLRELAYRKAYILDRVFSRLSKRYLAATTNYALGFVVVAKA